ncbi:YggS family pyridoxal phosphate-dependent enzyme [Candidatus Micrarchaeota archaeon]|nr:YggS family pyridoxal phosphate-dependent enzyme [Candidatus Micrarchaeota archaeon]
MALSDVLKKIPIGVTLVAAVKYAPDADAVNALIRAGVMAVGENRLQDAEMRLPFLLPCEKHFIGTLQSNKISKIVRLFDVVQSLDLLAHAEKLDAAAKRENKTMRVLVQINAGDEAQKSGLPPVKEKVASFLTSLRSFSHLKIEGLMVVVPMVGDSRPYFKKAKALFDSLKADFGLTVLSMGTSDDFETAIGEGSTMVRVGLVLFESGQSTEV